MSNNSNSSSSNSSGSNEELNGFGKIRSWLFPTEREKEKRLGKYIILQKVGEGAEAVVFSGRKHRYRSHKQAAEPLVALKVIRPTALKKNPRAETLRLKFEQLQHENIVRTLNSFYTKTANQPEVLVTVMDFCSKGDLYPKIRQLQQERFNLPIEWVMKWFIEITEAIAYLHANNIIHRDIKPENLFLTDKYCIKLGDFGVSTVVASGNLAKTFVGTPCYMAPELLADTPVPQYANSVDIWALGCIVFELLTPTLFIFEIQHHQLPGFLFSKKGTVPMDKQTLAEIQFEQHNTLKSYMRADCPTELQELIFKMISALPQDRITAAELLQDPYIQEWKRKLATTSPNPKDIEVLLNCRRFSVAGAVITIRTGDIFKEQVSAIVIPNSQTGACDSGLAKLIVAKEPSIKDDLQKKLNGEMIAIAEAIYTPLQSTQLTAQGVVHTVVPLGSSLTYKEELFQAFLNCLECASQQNCRSICFPSIGTGGSGIPAEECATAFFRSLEVFRNPNQMAITVVCHEFNVLEAFNNKYEVLTQEE